MMDKIFISGANGLQGNAIAHTFLDRGYAVSSLTSSEEALPKLAKQGINALHGGFHTTAALHTVMTDAKGAVIIFPLQFDEALLLEYTKNLIDVCSNQKVARIILVTGIFVPKGRTGMKALDIKKEIVERFRDSGLDCAFLEGDIYAENLVAPWSKPLLMNQGIMPYPIPAEKKIPWVTYADLGRFALEVYEQWPKDKKWFPINSFLATGAEMAASLEEQLKKHIQFIPVAPDDFEKQLSAELGPIAAKEVANIYRFVAQEQDMLVARSFSETNAILDFTPEDRQEWSKKIAW